jgi:hypothetical protein
VSWRWRGEVGRPCDAGRSRRIALYRLTMNESGPRRWNVVMCRDPLPRSTNMCAARLLQAEQAAWWLAVACAVLHVSLLFLPQGKSARTAPISI